MNQAEIEELEIKISEGLFKKIGGQIVWLWRLVSGAVIIAFGAAVYVSTMKSDIRSNRENIQANKELVAGMKDDFLKKIEDNKSETKDWRTYLTQRLDEMDKKLTEVLRQIK